MPTRDGSGKNLHPQHALGVLSVSFALISIRVQIFQFLLLLLQLGLCLLDSGLEVLPQLLQLDSLRSELLQSRPLVCEPSILHRQTRSERVRASGARSRQQTHQRGRAPSGEGTGKSERGWVVDGSKGICDVHLVIRLLHKQHVNKRKEEEETTRLSSLARNSFSSCQQAKPHTTTQGASGQHLFLDLVPAVVCCLP